MSNIKNLLLHCMENEQKYQKYNMLDDKDRLINKGWIQAIEYIISNCNVDDKTINEQKGKQHE